MANLDIKVKSSALIALHCQVGILNHVLTQPERSRMLTKLKKVIGTARKVGIPIIYAVVQFREDYPEISHRNILFNRIKDARRLRALDPDARICDKIQPLPKEIIVTHRRINAFFGSDLDLVLRAMGKDTILLAGVESLGVVESTARFAADMDYRTIVLADCCVDRDPVANEFAMTTLFPRVCTVCKSDDLLASIA